MPQASCKSEVKLWLDDVRPAPEGWVWARTNGAAKDILVNSNVVEISLDHDLGLDHLSEEQIDADHELMFQKGTSSETGYDLVNWMLEQNRVPAKVRIHSWNPVGAKAMAARLNRFGHNVVVDPFKPGGTVLL